jgi:quercetin dioxygenase-like cupin family protein
MTGTEQIDGRRLLIKRKAAAVAHLQNGIYHLPPNRKNNMNLYIPSAVSLFLLAAVPAYAGDAPASPASGNRQATPDGDARTITITRNGIQPSAKGPSQYFTGTVRVDPLFPAKEPSRTSGAYVTFEPGARSNWHVHPLGQILVVTAGTGRVQRWGGPAEEIRPGDVVWISPGQKHWHGASPTTAMTHLAIQEQLDGKNVQWMEPVTDEQYGK